MVGYKQNSRLIYVPTNNSYFPYFIPIVQFAMDPSVFLMTFNSLVIPKVAENMEVKKAGTNSPSEGSITPALYVPLWLGAIDVMRIVKSTWHWGMDSKKGSATKIFNLEFAFAFLFQFSIEGMVAFFLYANC